MNGFSQRTQRARRALKNNYILFTKYIFNEFSLRSLRPLRETFNTTSGDTKNYLPLV